MIDESLSTIELPRTFEQVPRPSQNPAFEYGHFDDGARLRPRADFS